MNIQEDYVSFETAKLLKEKGFDIPCDNYYDSSGKTPNESIYGGASIEILDYNADPFVKFNFPKFKTFSAPTQSMTMKWLRINYKIHIEIRYFPMSNIYRYVIIRSPATIENINSHPQYFNTYKEACEAAISYCLENLITT